MNEQNNGACTTCITITIDEYKSLLECEFAQRSSFDRLENIRKYYKMKLKRFEKSLKFMKENPSNGALYCSVNELCILSEFLLESGAIGFTEFDEVGALMDKYEELKKHETNHN